MRYEMNEIWMFFLVILLLVILLVLAVNCINFLKKILRDLSCLEDRVRYLEIRLQSFKDALTDF